MSRQVDVLIARIRDSSAFIKSLRLDAKTIEIDDKALKHIDNAVDSLNKAVLMLIYIEEKSNVIRKKPTLRVVK